MGSRLPGTAHDASGDISHDYDCITTEYDAQGRD
jgi:hypothetical protein